MPGANYFLSQVAAQTPGHLLGAIVPPKLTPPQCLELISTPRIEPYISVIGTKSNVHRDVVSIPPKHVAISGYGNRAPKPRYNHSYSPSPPPVLQPPPQIAPNAVVKAPHIAPAPPGIGTTDAPNVRRKQDNPVGELQELCTKMRWVFPTYYIFCDEAQPHERAFCVVVRLYRFREKGEAKSKRAAKREAASRILNRLRSWPSDVPIQFNHCGAPSQSSKPPTELMPFKPSKVHISPPPSYYINELSMLSQKHNFSAAYVKVDEPTESGDIQFVLQLSTCPVVVINGTGRSLFLAKADAAKKALDCLRIMCKSYFTRPVAPPPASTSSAMAPSAMAMPARV